MSLLHLLDSTYTTAKELIELSTIPALHGLYSDWIVDVADRFRAKADTITALGKQIGVVHSEYSYETFQDFPDHDFTFLNKELLEKSKSTVEAGLDYLDKSIDLIVGFWKVYPDAQVFLEHLPDDASLLSSLLELTRTINKLPKLAGILKTRMEAFMDEWDLTEHKPLQIEVKFVDTSKLKVPTDSPTEETQDLISNIGPRVYDIIDLSQSLGTALKSCASSPWISDIDKVRFNMQAEHFLLGSKKLFSLAASQAFECEMSPINECIETRLKCFSPQLFEKHVSVKHMLSALVDIINAPVAKYRELVQFNRNLDEAVSTHKIQENASKVKAGIFSSGFDLFDMQLTALELILKDIAKANGFKIQLDTKGLLVQYIIVSER